MVPTKAGHATGESTFSFFTFDTIKRNSARLSDLCNREMCVALPARKIDVPPMFKTSSSLTPPTRDSDSSSSDFAKSISAEENALQEKLRVIQLRKEEAEGEKGTESKANG